MVDHRLNFQKIRKARILEKFSYRVFKRWKNEILFFFGKKFFIIRTFRIFFGIKSEINQMVIFTMKVKITLNWAAKLNLNQWKFIEPISRMTSLNPEYFWYFAFRVSLFWKFWKYHLEINFAWFTSQSWFYPESEITHPTLLKIKTCLFLNFEIFQIF